jgi:uncharacterized protein (DUF427 family)
MTVTASHDIRVEHSRKRVRILLAGELVADTTAALLVWEVPYFPTYYVPTGDVTAKLVPAGDAHDPRLGTAELFTVQVPGGTTADRAARKYPDSPARQLHDAVRFEWDAMSEWLEEDEPVYTHARDPHTRVDILASSRHVRVEIDGRRLAQSAHPVRDRPAASLLPAAQRHQDRPAAAVRHPDPLPVQGNRQLLVGRHRQGAAPGRRVDLPDAATREPEGGRSRGFLRREGGRLHRRNAAAPTADQVELARDRALSAVEIRDPRGRRTPAGADSFGGDLGVSQGPQRVTAGQLATVGL